MELLTSSWLEIEEYLKKLDGIIIPIGSIEQHGPIGLIGTDMLCVDVIAKKFGEKTNTLIAPTIGYSPAEFNMDFPGTISISPKLFEDLCCEVITSFVRHGFKHVYILNGHGANLEPLNRVTCSFENIQIRIKSWWDFTAVNELRKLYYGDWEGMHATPSEISITQVANRIINPSLAKIPPKKLSKKYIKDHSGDKHGNAKDHKNSFPDGRVGSHSALASREHGLNLIKTVVSEVQKDYLEFLKT